MYVLRTTVSIEGKPVDAHDQPFGFREWGVRGDQFTLNGVVWPVWGDLVGSAATKEEWLAKYRRTNQRSVRLMGAAQGGIRWMGMTTDDALDWFDRSGVVVRRSGPLDGESIGYNAIENDPELKKLTGSEIKMDLMKNWRDQMVAQVKGERNHPSIMLWSIENEWLYINCLNLYGGLMDAFEREVTACAKDVRAADPTRLVMTDGGGANKDQSIPVHGNHYVYGDRGASKYPPLAYEANPTGGGRDRWVWDRKRPRFIGEDFYATGIMPADYAIYGGESAFLGKTEARPAASLLYRILTSGYRWAGQSAWTFWLSDDNVAGDYALYNAPRAVIGREWDGTFGSGQKVLRRFRIYNDTQHADPIRFAWTLTIGGKMIAGETKAVSVPPGEYRPADLTLPMPRAARRLEGVLQLSLAVNGNTVFADARPVSVLPPARPAPVRGLLVYDPKGAVARFLKGRGAAFTPVASLGRLPASGRVLLVGPGALTEAESASSRLAAWAVGGRRVVILEQDHPLKYQGIPAGIEPSDASGFIAFAEDLSHPALRGLSQRDFFTWGPDGSLYKNAYVKPTQGAKSLVQCHDRLQNSALVEAPVGTGLMLLCQLAVGEKIADNAVAQHLLCNLIDAASRYRQTFRPVTTVATPGGLLEKTLDAIGLRRDRANDPAAALSRPGVRLLVVEATPANLKALAANRGKVDAFERIGGYIVLNGLTPEGLADYNRLVGFDHMIRPFGREKVTFPARRSPLTSGLTSGDLVMLSGERIFGWTSDEYVADDEFSYVVDLDDVAPFMRFPNDFARLMVNGFRNADAWKYIVNLPLKDADWTLTLPKPQTLTSLTWAPNMNYNAATKVSLSFDGKETRTFVLKPNDDPQTLPLKPPVQASTVRVRIVEAEKDPARDGDLTGLDNLSIAAQRPADFARRVRPMTNIGAIVEYPKGPGGIVLCNLRFKESEAAPINAVKKRTILATLLRNLDAPFTSGKTVIAGGGLDYVPIDLSKAANQYRDERGWFGDKGFTFNDLPTGTQTFAGVTYRIYDFPTSPVPTAVMLRGDGVPNALPDAVTNIPVGRKADALFFLQAARIDRRRNGDDRKNGRRFEVARYVVHYADGKAETAPIVAEEDVDDYRQKSPTALPGAQIAWTKPYAGTGFAAVAYAKQWTNPRPDAPIASVDLVYGPDRAGVPVLLALTAATARPDRGGH